MQYIDIIWFFIVAYVIYKIEGNIYNPITSFFLLWSFIILLVIFNFVGFYETSQITYLIIFLGMNGFLIGYLSIILPRHASGKDIRLPKPNFEVQGKDSEQNELNYKYEFRYKLIFVLAVICIVMQTVDVIANIKMLMIGQSFNDIYLYKTINGEINSGSGLEKIISVLIIQPFTLVLIPIWVVDYFSGTKNRWLTICTLLCTIFYSLQQGRRLIILYAIVMFIVIIMTLNKKIKISKKVKRIMALILIGGFGFIIYLSTMRGIEDLPKSFYTYFCGCVPHLDYRLNEIRTSRQYTYGLTILSGYLTPVFIGLKGVFGIQYPVLWTRATTLFNVENTVLIGSGVTYNAFVSPFFYFYLDAGVLGVFFGMMIYGVICSLAYISIKRIRNIRNIMCYALIELGLLFSMFQFHFVSYPYALSFIYIILITKKEDI